MPQIPSVVRDAAYVAIGFGVLTFQRAQVQRRELTETIEDRVKLVEERLEAVQKDVDKLFDELETKLPDQARELFHAARGAAKDAEGQLRALVRAS
jgi:hypothetical protein